jgi:ferric-dicitrate binding protein FerR (iron transport regulator)
LKPSCARAWQIEALRDGRLRGKDLESARRHQAACAECTRRERELVALGQQISGLPELGRDPLTVRRARQQLLTELNEAVLRRSETKPARRAAFVLAFASLTLAGTCFVVSHRARSPDAAAPSKSVIDVRAQPGARWSEHQDREQDRVDLLDGAAAFTVHAHSGRRVVIRLPDGELEDTGTVFEVRVSEQRTTHIAVREGRVLVRLGGLPGFALGAGDSWESPATPAPTAVAAEPSSAMGIPRSSALRAAAAKPPEQLASSSLAGERARSHAAHERAATRSGSESARTPGGLADAPPDAERAKAEDDAYLQIVDLLRQGQYADARAEAKSYLLRFPNGFRRVEVLNVATRSAGESTGVTGGH